MNTDQLTAPQDRFARRVTARLSAGTAELPYEVSERLRAARAQALARRKRVAGLRTAPVVAATGSVATLSGDEGFSWWRRVASVLPIIALAAGLVAIHTIQNERRANEVAEVDAALLTDDLPPDAYTDPGFIQFLQQQQTANKE
jgi:hypothetical protein